MFFSRVPFFARALPRAALLLASLLATACEDRCATVECEIAGAVCSPDDGMCHCGTPAGAVCGEGDYCQASAGTCSDVPTPVCTAGTRWEPGTQAFRESTSWGIELALGSRIEAVDYDGDGWTDLLVRGIPAGWEDFSAGGARKTWLLRNTGEGRFEDVTEASGLLTPRGGASGGRPVEVVAWGDVDGDGDLDAYLGINTVDLEGANRGETSEIMLQDEPGHFVVGPDSAVRSHDYVDSPAAASFVDYDLDGDLDLWVGQHNYTASGSVFFQQDRLWRNDGTGRFEDATIAAGLETEEWRGYEALDEARAHSRAWSSAACDLTGDGLPELLVASYGRAPNHLWQARREGDAVVYANESIASGYAFDENQTWEDNQFARCYCRDNPTAEDCAGVPAPVLAMCSPNWNHDNDRHPFRLGGNSGSTICSDVDNDGDIDLLTTEIRHWWAGAGSDAGELLVNQGGSDARFVRPGRDATGLVVPHANPTVWDEGLITAAIFDFDLDGWADVWLGGSEYPGNYGLLYHQESALSFREVPVTDGIDHHRAQGVVAADFDRDGDLDVIVGHSRARCEAPATDCYPTAQPRFFENVLGDGGNWAQLRLEGAGSTSVNGAAIGARVSLTAGGVTQTREVQGGHGHYGDQGDLVMTFGLGAACEADVTVRWPDAALTTESFRVSAGHRFRVRPGARPALDDLPAAD